MSECKRQLEKATRADERYRNQSDKKLRYKTEKQDVDKKI